MLIIYIDIVLLVILFFLTVFTCGYCVYRVYRLQRAGQVTILLRPTKVLFSHKKEGETTEALRTVVAYQNPFTGDYCVHKSRQGPKGYVNAAPGPASPDSGLSDEYEPLNLEMPGPQQNVPPMMNGKPGLARSLPQLPQPALKEPLTPKRGDNSVNKTWNWNYTEYQI